MSAVLYERDGRIGRVTLNRPEVMNAIDDRLPDGAGGRDPAGECRCGRSRDRAVRQRPGLLRRL